MNARRKNLTELGRLSSRVLARALGDGRPGYEHLGGDQTSGRSRRSGSGHPSGAERQAPAINASSFGALVLGLRLSNPAEFRRVSRRLRRRSSAKNLSLPVEDFSLVSALPNELFKPRPADAGGPHFGCHEWSLTPSCDANIATPLDSNTPWQIAACQ
jgi:hypothetical protein